MGLRGKKERMATTQLYVPHKLVLRARGEGGGGGSLTGLRTAERANLSRFMGRVAENSRVCLGQSDSVTFAITCS